MKRTTLVSAEKVDATVPAGQVSGSLKIFFSYAPCSGTTAAMLDEAEGLMGSGRDVFVADRDRGASAGRDRPFDLDQVLARKPDVVVLENLALPNPAGARNRTRYQDAEELLRAGISVYATLRVSDLKNEQPRVAALGVETPPEPVPDYLLYDASQLEFVDIDPSELTARAKASGREVPASVLNDLRVLALRCVSEYAACAGLGRAAHESGTFEAARLGRGCVVAVVGAGEPPARVLREAARLASRFNGGLEAVCVRRAQRPGSSAAAHDESLHAALEEQVEAMGYPLTTLYGDDAAEIVRDYLRAQGATDVVAARRKLSWARRLAAAVQPRFEDRVVEGLSGVAVHLVPDDGAATLHPSSRRRSAPEALRWRDVAVIAGVCLAAFAVVRVLQAFGFGEAVSYLVFLGGFVAVALLTRSYTASFVAVALGCLAQDYFFIRSYMQLSIDHRASLLVFAAFAAVSVVATAAVVRVGRAADRADRRERRTQALFDLNHSLLYAHGATEAVDIALESTTRLFERSACIYLRDPFADAGVPGVRERARQVTRGVPGDLDPAEFDRITEQAVAHWVFSNGEPAGSGTDTHGESDIHYLPLVAGEGIEGVLAVSDKRRLTLADHSFLDLVASQVAFALERQSLAAKHRGDLSAMRATRIRSAFASGLVASVAVSADTVHALSDVLASVPEDDRAYRDAIARVISEESARGRLMVDRMRGVLEAPVSAVCDVRAEVCSAVDEVREGLSGKVIDLEPGEPVPPVVADAALVRVAVRLVLEASASYVGNRGIVQVSVSSYPDRVSVVVADDRSVEMGASRSAAFELSARTGRDGEPLYEETRARSLRETLLDRATVAGDSQAAIAALCRALRLPEGAVRSGSDRDGLLNRQRMLRFDRLEYGLYMAGLIVRAHGGTIKQRYRLGGGAVVTFTLPRD